MSTAARKARKRSGQAIEREAKVPTTQYLTDAQRQAERRRDRKIAATTQALVMGMLAGIER